jgi:hypothetical protein
MKTSLFVFFSIVLSSLALTLDPVPKPGQKPYSPAEGNTVLVNPPPFIWVPADRNSAYDLQISRSEDFSNSTTYPDIDLNVFVPAKPLASGGWFWRYGVKTKDGTAWGKARPFTVSHGATQFPFPDTEKALARVPKDHPRLFFTGQHLAKARDWSKGELKPQIDALCRQCDRTIGKEVVAEPARPKNGPERVVVMRTTRPPMDDMERCALAYLITGEKKYGDEAKRRIMHFFAWDPKGSTCLWSYDEPPMWMMMRGIRAYDWTYNLFSPAERNRIEPVMKERARQFYVHLREKRTFHSTPYNSHAGRMPGFLGEACLCFAHEWPEAREWFEYSNLLYFTSYPAWGGDDGGWAEGPSYWGAYMRFALHYVAALREATGIDLIRKPFFTNTPRYALYTATPYHQFAPFGDNQQHSTRGLGSVMYAFSYLLKDPHYLWHAESTGRKPGGDVLTLATYDPNLKSARPDTLPGAGHFPAVGLAAFHTALGDRESDVSLVFRSSPYGSVSHGHADQNAFVIEAFGRGLALATGFYPWYGSPHHHDWTRATKAVNSVLVDGEGQLRRKWEASGQIVRFATTNAYDYVCGEAAAAYGGKLERFRRHIVQVKPGVFVMMDDLVSKKPSTFQWLLHAVNRVAIDGSVLSVKNKPAAMEVHLLSPVGATLSQHDKYDPGPEVSPMKKANYPNTWHIQVSTANTSTNARFLTVFDVHRNGENSQLAKVTEMKLSRGLGARLTFRDGRTEEVSFRFLKEQEFPIHVRAMDKGGKMLREWAVR